MSDQEQQDVSQQEDQQNQDQDEEEDQDNQDEDEDQQQGDQDQDQDDDQEQQDQQDQQQQQQEEDQKTQKQQANQKLPKFRQIQTQQFKFSSLLSQISSLSMNVDHFINTLPSHGGPSYYRSTYVQPSFQYKPPTILQIPKQQPKIVIMKDEDIQVSMQPQIVIQPTKKQKTQPPEPYKISNQSNKFLAQLYQQNKKLKRWQNSSHNANSHFNQGSSTSGFYGSRQRFERQQFQKGLFNVEQRNKEIDEAMELLKRSQQ